jgi:penicillin-binding protein 1A
MMNTSWRLRLLALIACLGLSVGALLIFVVLVVYPTLPDMTQLQKYQPKLPLQVYTADGELLGQFGQEHRIYLDTAHTSSMLIAAILAAEDERFYEHSGIDFIGIARAILSNLSSGHIQSGASTITMQVARNFFLSSQKTLLRKINEALLAYKIEKSLNKQQILSLYINQIYLGQRSYGFAEAALTYFGKPINQLSIAEYATLAGLPKAPSAYNPINNPIRSHERTLYVLKRMLTLHKITFQQYQIAIHQPLTIKSTKNYSEYGAYIAEMVRQYLYPQYGEQLYTAGLKVYTTIDSRLQKAAYLALRNGLINYDASLGYRGAELVTNIAGENLIQQALVHLANISDIGDLLAAIVVAKNPTGIDVILRSSELIHIIPSEFPIGFNINKITIGAVIRLRSLNGKHSIVQIPQVQGALVALNTHTGSIVALMGGFDFNHNNFNHVTQAKRQPGSSFKPFIYSAALESGITAATIVDDSAICFNDTGMRTEWCPRDDDNEFLGPITVREGLSLSRNIVAVKVLHQISPQYAVQYLSKFAFNPQDFQPYLTLALGANEATPLQMAQAYLVFANGGYLLDPYLINKITDYNGKVIARTIPPNLATKSHSIDPRNAFIITSMLQDAATHGTGARAAFNLKRSDLAGKTGTTTDSKDVWFDGYTPNIVAVTWVGYDQPKSLGRQFGSTLALPIWIDFMRTALLDSPIAHFAMPTGLVAEENATWQHETEYSYDSNNNISEPDKDDQQPADEDGNDARTIDDIIKNIND